MQSEVKTEKRIYRDRPEQADPMEMLDDLLRCIKKYWVQLLLLLVTVTAVVVAYLNWTYEPTYSAKITYAVNKTGVTESDAALAKRLSSAVGKIYSTYEFQADLQEAVKEKVSVGSCRIGAQYTEGANLFTISISSEQFQNVDPVLKAFQEIYPVWADKSNGSVELEVVDLLPASEQPDNAYSMVNFAVKGLLLGLILVAAFVFIYAQTLHTVRKEKDMKKVTSKGCIALIPDTRLKKRSNEKKTQLLISNKRIDWGFRQSVLSAQSRLDQLMSRQDQKVLLVTSTLPQEGKSLISVNLALAAAQNGKKTVIIDGDFRNPSVGRLFDFEENTPGLSNYFTDNTDVDEIIIEKKNLSVIGAGTKKSGVSGIISDGMMQDLIRYLRKTYDLIIIDTPPSGLFSDAAILSKYTDAVLYIVRHDTAEVREIQEGIRPFILDNKLDGYIINRNHAGLSTYGKYGKYGYSRYGNYGKYKRYVKPSESSMNTEDTL